MPYRADSGELRHAGEAGFHAPGKATALRGLAVLGAGLATAGSIDEVVTVAVSHLAGAVGAVVSTLLLVDGDRLVFVGSHGLPPDKLRRWATFPVEDVTPAGEAVRTGAPVVAATAAEVRSRYPQMAADTPHSRSVVCLPLRSQDAVLGAIALTFERNWCPGTDELDFLMTFADSCAQTIRRVQATEESARRAAQLRFLADASVELSSSLDYRATLANVARLAVPDLADWCAVDLLTQGELSTLALAHVDPHKVSWAWQLRERYPDEMSAPTGSPHVVRSGTGELYPEISDHMLVAAAKDAEHLHLMRELDLRSMMIVPLIARGHTLGTISFVRSESIRPYSPEDLAMAEDLGRRAGIAIDNARLHERTAGVALQLQRAVLPDRLDAVPGWEIATHYSPDGRAEVGGDFFDAVPLGDGRLCLFIGDVVGHGVRAAAAMAQMRASVRAFVTVDPTPTAVITKLDHMFAQLGLGSFVTMLYAVIDPGRGVSFVNAGHSPPLWVTSGDAHFLSGPTRTPVGVAPSRTLSVCAPFGRDDVLLLCTDGLFERRDEDIDVGLGRLLRHAPLLNRRPLAEAVDELVRTLDSGSAHDDVAVIAARARP